MSDEPKPRQQSSRATDRPGPMLVMLWVITAVMLLLVGLWISG